jgi:uncharacterized membrane protein YbhN (UPF0104 family)
VFDFFNIGLVLVIALIKVSFKTEFFSLGFIFIVGQIFLVLFYMLAIRMLHRSLTEKDEYSLLGKCKSFFYKIIDHQRTHSFWQLLRLHILSMVITSCMFYFSLIVMEAFGVVIPLSLFILGWGLSIIGSLIPLQGFFGFGSMEAGWFVPLTSAGLSQAFTLAISVNYHIVSLLFSFILFGIGAIYLFVRRHFHSNQNKPQHILPQ